MKNIEKTNDTRVLSEADLIRIRNFRLFDDKYMIAFFDGNIEATQLVLRIILEATGNIRDLYHRE